MSLRIHGRVLQIDTCMRTQYAVDTSATFLTFPPLSRLADY